MPRLCLSILYLAHFQSNRDGISSTGSPVRCWNITAVEHAHMTTAQRNEAAAATTPAAAPCCPACRTSRVGKSALFAEEPGLWVVIGRASQAMETKIHTEYSELGLYIDEHTNSRDRRNAPFLPMIRPRCNHLSDGLSPTYSRTSP